MSSQEALLNELKGSIFEYLVARHIARTHQIEENFLTTLDQNYQRLLQQQDLMLRECFPEMPQYLQAWSQKCAQHFLSSHNSPLTMVRLAGQLSHLKELSECDIEVGSGEKSSLVSLKLNKKQGYVNTKSAGVKSFFSFYFPAFLDLQELFSLKVESEHALMKQELFEWADLNPELDWQAWRLRGLSELPGELPDEARAILHRTYHRLAQTLEESLLHIRDKDPQGFKAGLLKLLGFSQPEIVQLICFHELQSKNPRACEVFVHPYESALTQLQKIEFEKSKETASVELKLKDWMLQIRIKPMNKFTTTAIKINCSVKY